MSVFPSVTEVSLASMVVEMSGYFSQPQFPFLQNELRHYYPKSAGKRK